MAAEIIGNKLHVNGFVYFRSKEAKGRTYWGKAEDHPEQPSAQLLRAELHRIPGGVLSQLPEQPAIVRTIRRARRKNLPPNPRALRILMRSQLYIDGPQ